MSTGYYITKEGEKVNLSSAPILFLSNKNIEELVLPQDALSISCCRNHLTKLILPKSVTHIHCYGNKIKELILPQDLQNVRCDMMNGIEGQYKKNMSMHIYQSNFVFSQNVPLSFNIR